MKVVLSGNITNEIVKNLKEMLIEKIFERKLEGLYVNYTVVITDSIPKHCIETREFLDLDIHDSMVPEEMKDMKVCIVSKSFI